MPSRYSPKHEVNLCFNQVYPEFGTRSCILLVCLNSISVVICGWFLILSTIEHQLHRENIGRESDLKDLENFTPTTYTKLFAEQLDIIVCERDFVLRQFSDYLDCHYSVMRQRSCVLKITAIYKIINQVVVIQHDLG